MKKDAKKEKKEPSVSEEELNDKDMTDILIELRSTNYWPAIMRLNRRKDAEAITALASNDPFKEPTVMARTQGMRMGLYFLEQYVLAEMKKREGKGNEEND